jgi:hypothetical protein
MALSPLLPRLEEENREKLSKSNIAKKESKSCPMSFFKTNKIRSNRKIHSTKFLTNTDSEENQKSEILRQKGKFINA